jgi:hypothetical protein
MFFKLLETHHFSHYSICGRKVKATYQGKSVVVELVDHCTGCAMHDLDFSPAAFAQIGPMERGRLHGMTVSSFCLNSKYQVCFSSLLF